MKETPVAQEVQEDQEYQEEEAAVLEEVEVEVLVVPHMQEERWEVTHQQNSTVTAPKRSPL